MNSTTLARSILNRRAARAVCGLALAAAGLFFGGCASYSPAQNLDLLVNTAPLPRLVKPGQEFATAERTAAQSPGAIAFAGKGCSMDPLYVEGTAIVVQTADFNSLRKGTPVVYQNRAGRYVAHMLVEQLPKGWVAIGLNNADADEELVTNRNLVGVISAAYAAADTNFRPDIAARIAMNERVAQGAQVTALLR